MRTAAIIVFFAIFFLATGLISFYIFIRGLQSIPAGSTLRNAYIPIFWTVALSFIAGRLLETVFRSFFTDLLIWIGSFWIAAMIYFLLSLAALDLLRLMNHFVPLFPAFITRNYAEAKYITAAGLVGLVGIALLAGHINSVVPRVFRLDLPVARRDSKLDQLDIVAISDIHLGTIVGRSRFDAIVKKINSMNPDLVLLPGDIVDEDLRPVIRQNLGEALGKIRSRFGAYGITGNHEYIGGVEQACGYLAEHNIKMLRDESLKVADSFFLVGREDLSKGMRPPGPRRMKLSDLMQTVDRNYPAILMDHQPFGLSEAAEQGLDLQISGHTHNGQLWPINYIVKRIYELPWGYKKISGTHFYVSDGVGTWGPPVRIGNRPEIVHIHLDFK